MRVPQCIVSVPGSVCTAAGRLRFPRFPFGLRFGFMFYILPCLPAERPLRLCCLVRRCVATRVPMDCVCLRFGHTVIVAFPLRSILFFGAVAAVAAAASCRLPPCTMWPRARVRAPLLLARFFLRSVVWWPFVAFLFAFRCAFRRW